MQHKDKRLVIINLYHILTVGLKANGICSSLTQYHLSNGKAKNYAYQKNNISNIIIAGDYN